MDTNGAMKIINWNDSKNFLPNYILIIKKLLRNKKVIFPEDIEKKDYFLDKLNAKY